MHFSKLMLLLACLLLGFARAPAAARPESAPAAAAPAYDQLFRRIETVNVNRHESVTSAFGVTFVLRYQSLYLKYWSAEVPASDTSPHLFLDYRERIPGRSPGGSFLVITFPEPSYTLAAAGQHYPNLALTRPPGHSMESGWTYEIPGGANEIGFGFDASQRYLESISVATRLRDPWSTIPQ